MTLSNRRIVYVLIFAALAGGGCHSTGEPLALLLRGTFVLRTVNGGPLPADVSTQPPYQTILLADTMRFEGKGLATASVTQRFQSPTSPPEVVNYKFDYRVRIVGETIYLTFICPPNANCINITEVSGHLADANTFVLGDSRTLVYTRP